jgi:uncharacterized protein
MEYGQPSYLFGTLHEVGLEVQLPDFDLAARLESTEVLALEQVSDWPGENLIEHAIFRDNKALFQVLKDGQYRRTCRFFKHFSGLQPEVLDDYQPVYLAVLAAQYQRREGVYMDWVFRDMAAIRGIPIVGLESMTEQMAVLESLDRKEQAQLLDAMVRRKHRPVSNQDAVVRNYLRSDLDSLYILLTSRQHPAYLPQVITGRNRLLAERIESLTGRYSAFVAISAAHLAGEDNLLDQLRALGLTVTPIAPGAPVKPDIIPAAEQILGEEESQATERDLAAERVLTEQEAPSAEQAPEAEALKSEPE